MPASNNRDCVEYPSLCEQDVDQSGGVDPELPGDQVSSVRLQFKAFVDGAEVTARWCGRRENAGAERINGLIFDLPTQLVFSQRRAEVRTDIDGLPEIPVRILHGENDNAKFLATQVSLASLSPRGCSIAAPSAAVDPIVSFSPYPGLRLQLIEEPDLPVLQVLLRHHRPMANLRTLCGFQFVGLDMTTRGELDKLLLRLRQRIADHQIG